MTRVQRTTIGDTSEKQNRFPASGVPPIPTNQFYNDRDDDSIYRGVNQKETFTALCNFLSVPTFEINIPANYMLCVRLIPSVSSNKQDELYFLGKKSCFYSSEKFIITAQFDLQHQKAWLSRELQTVLLLQAWPPEEVRTLWNQFKNIGVFTQSRILLRPCDHHSIVSNCNTWERRQVTHLYN